MENLSRIAKGIFLGNGEIWNFLDYAVNRDCGGLMVYTRKNKFLGNNLINNFSGGGQRKYECGDINPTNEYKNVSYFANNFIGDLYSVPEGNNSTLKFKTKDDFYYTHLDYRLNHWARVYDEANSYVNTSAKSYKYEVDGETTDTGLPFVGFGSEYGVNTYKKIVKTDTISSFGVKAREFASKKNIFIKEKLGSNRGTQTNEYELKDYSTNHTIRKNSSPTEYIENGEYKKYKDLIEVADIIMDKQQTGIKHLYFYTGGPEFNNFGDRRIVPSTEEVYDSILYAKSSDPIKWIDIKYEYTTKFPYKESRTSGIYEIYEPERLLSIKNIKNKWSREISYGVEFNERGQEYYSINEENKFKGNVSISSEFNGGEHSIFNSDKNKRSYSYFQESEKNAMPKLLSTSVSDGSSVSLTDYSNASKLLKKTNQLFKDAKIGSLINRFHTNGIGEGGDLITAYNETYGMSRGRNLLRADGVDTSSGYENPYCRVWTVHHQYSKLKDRIRPFVDDKGDPKSLAEMQSNYGDLRTSEGRTNLDSYSVLRKDGFVRITPTHDKGEYTNSKDKIRNYMFSIENLAWRDITADENSTALSTEQRGPNGGRIMWFPPYNLKFSENVNVNWNANNFIGRGEEIYTYTNTVRSGTLDFTLLIDHPSILNKWRGMGVEVENKEERERDLLRFFAGCGNINDEVLPKQPVKEEQERPQEGIPKTNPEPVFHSDKIAYIIFFPNDFSGKDYVNKNNIDEVIGKLSKYNTGGPISERDEAYKDEVLQLHNLNSNGLNPSSYSQSIKQEFFAGYDNIKAEDIKYFNDLLVIKNNFKGDTIFGYPSRNCKINNIEIKGFASSHGYVKNNLELCNKRRTIIKKLLESQYSELSEANVTYTELEGSIIQVNNIDGLADINSINAKLARAAYAIIDITWKEDNVTYEYPIESGTTNVYGYIPRENLPKTGGLLNKNMVSNVQTIEYSEKEYTYDNEYMYFSEIIDDKLVYKNIVDKVRFFDPAFHSITPEGFNARLTFLHQCTRQGPTNAVSSGRVKGRVTDEGGHLIEEGSPDYLKFAGNLAFGRAPYCILRIGDFFNTKICIDSMSITYDNNGTQWDLNPEGIGVQPMYANISISFKFLGGQDITRPIERLQNAVTSNYYANASIYSRHADNNNFYYDVFEDKPKEK